MQALLNICAAEVKKLGFRYNAKKTNVVQLVGVTLCNETLTLSGQALGLASLYKYIRVTLCAGGDIYREHEEIVKRMALRAHCVLQRRGIWGLNRYLLVRDMWKLVHVSALTFCIAVVCLCYATM